MPSQVGNALVCPDYSIGWYLSDSLLPGDSNLDMTIQKKLQTYILAKKNDKVHGSIEIFVFNL